MTKTFLVTGGAGFIGSHLVESLVLEGHKVIICDDLSSGFWNNIALVKDKVSCIEEKIQNVKMGTLKVDGIFHLAAQVSVPLSIDNFYESSSNNIQSTLWIFDYALRNNVPVVYASSSAVYGNMPLGDDRVSDMDILSPYAVDKYCSEIYANMAFNLRGVPSLGLRFYNVYGPRQNLNSQYSGVISIFVKRMLEKQSVVINGGHQTRDFIFVGDIINTLIISMEKCLSEKICEVLNVGTGVSISIDELFDVLNDDIGNNTTKEYHDLPVGDPIQSFGDYTKINEVLEIDVSQFLTVKDGLNITVSSLKKNEK